MPGRANPGQIHPRMSAPRPIRSARHRRSEHIAGRLGNDPSRTHNPSVAGSRPARPTAIWRRASRPVVGRATTKIAGRLPRQGCLGAIESPRSGSLGRFATVGTSTGSASSRHAREPVRARVPGAFVPGEGRCDQRRAFTEIACIAMGRNVSVRGRTREPPRLDRERRPSDVIRIRSDAGEKFHIGTEGGIQ
jgi:hypothetical protein